MFKRFQTAADNSWEAEDSRTLSRRVNLSRAERFDSLQSVALNEKDLRGIMNTRGVSMAVVFVPEILVKQTCHVFDAAGQVDDER